MHAGACLSHVKDNSGVRRHFDDGRSVHCAAAVVVVVVEDDTDGEA